MKTPVTETPWANGIILSYNRIAEALPAAKETELKLWQLRVDRSEAGHKTEYCRKLSLYSVRCLRYTRTIDGNVTTMLPVEPREELTLMVAAESGRQAFDLATKELVAHGYGEWEWALSLNRSILVLA